ncbi:unnamed protein product [Urochloa humidicola]
MMLPEGHGLYPGHPDLHGFLRFFNLSTGAIVRAHLPLLHDHVILDSIDGLLLLHRDHDTAIRLLHPFTGDVVELPTLASLRPQVEFPTGLLIVIASVSVGSTLPLPSTGTITIMLALKLLHRVAYATAGDRRWTLLDWKIQPLIKPVSFQGKLYAMEIIYKDDIQKFYIYQINPPNQEDAAQGRQSHLMPVPVKIVECPMEMCLYTLNLSSVAHSSC